MARRRRAASWTAGTAMVAAAAAVSSMIACGLRSQRQRVGTCATGAPPAPPRRAPPPPSSADPDDVITSEELQAAARKLNVELRENIVGPWYQMELYSADGRQLGKTSGWAQPWGILHLETIEVRRFTGYWVAKPPNLRMGKKNEKSEEEIEADKEKERKAYADVAKVARWFGLLLSCSIACWNKEKAPFYCREAHLLAIKDEEMQGTRLVRYYKSLGFETIRESGELTLQDQVTWGGDGTLMITDSEEFMKRWTPVVRALASRGVGSTSAGGRKPRMR